MFHLQIFFLLGQYFRLTHQIWIKLHTKPFPKLTINIPTHTKSATFLTFCSVGCTIKLLTEGTYHKWWLEANEAPNSWRSLTGLRMCCTIARKLTICHLQSQRTPMWAQRQQSTISIIFGIMLCLILQLIKLSSLLDIHLKTSIFGIMCLCSMSHPERALTLAHYANKSTKLRSMDTCSGGSKNN